MILVVQPYVLTDNDDTLYPLKRSPAVLGPYRLQRLVAVAVNGNFRINHAYTPPNNLPAGPRAALKNGSPAPSPSPTHHFDPERSPAVLGPYRLQRLVTVAVNGNFRINHAYTPPSKLPMGQRAALKNGSPAPSPSPTHHFDSEVKPLALSSSQPSLFHAVFRALNPFTIRLVYQRAPFLIAFPAFWRLVATYRSALYAVYGLSPPFPLPGSAAVPLPCIYSSPLLLALPTGSPHRWAASCTATDYIPLSVLRASDRSLASSQCALRLLAAFHTLVASPRFLSPVRVPPHRGIPAAPFVLSTVCRIPWIAVCDIRIDPAPASAPSSAVQRKCCSSATDNSYTAIDVSRL
ncbi:hypothetical protein DFH06DRAFT_1341835 [Mycena polygramma]|nr:hypothetical protein DFH06DRAFT_1341835 [Mycena polygramma]